MSGELQVLEAWASTLLAKLQPAQCRTINTRWPLRRNTAPYVQDDKAYTALIQRKQFKGKNKRIKRQKTAIFTKNSKLTELNL